MHTLGGFMAARREREVAERAALDEQIWPHHETQFDKPKKAKKQSQVTRLSTMTPDEVAGIGRMRMAR